MLCTPALAQGLQQPSDLARLPLLRSYRTDEWTAWFAAAGLPCPVLRGAVFDSSLTLAEAAAQGAGRRVRAGRIYILPLCHGTSA